MDYKKMAELVAKQLRAGAVQKNCAMTKNGYDVSPRTEIVDKN